MCIHSATPSHTTQDCGMNSRVSLIGVCDLTLCLCLHTGLGLGLAHTDIHTRTHGHGEAVSMMQLMEETANKLRRAPSFSLLVSVSLVL